MAGVFSGGELLPDVAGEIGVGGLPGFRFRVVEDQVAEFGDDRALRACRRARRYRAGPRCLVWLRETSSPSSALRTCVIGGVLPTTSLLHDGGFGRLARDLVVILQGHDQHGVRVFPELHEVGHAADDAAVGGLAEGRLVDRAVGTPELVIGPVEFAACFVAVRLGPAFVLGLQDAAGAVTQADQGGKAFADQRAVRLSASCRHRRPGTPWPPSI